MSRLTLHHVASPYDIDEDAIALAHYERELRKQKGVDPRDPDFVDLPLQPRFSAPARLVQPVEQVSNTLARFSRSLDERHPTERSSCAEFVPMDEERMDHADRIVLAGSLAAGLACLVLILAQEFLS